MPYINHKEKLAYLAELAELKTAMRTSDTFSLNGLPVGHLNYILSKVCLAYLDIKGEGYQTYNDIMGALEGAKLEMYRRPIATYEDIKLEKNGDI